MTDETKTALLSKLRTPVAHELPHWEEVSAKLERDETLTPLEFFIYENEPAGGDGADAWRDQLAAALASAPVAGEAKPVAYRAWFDQDNGARWLFTLWPEEERLDVQWEPLYAAPQASEAVRDALQKLVKLEDMRLRLRALHESGHGTDYDYYHKALPAAWDTARAALSAQPGAQKEQSDAN